MPASRLNMKSMSKENPAILIILMGSLGDLVRGLCIVAPLKKRFPRGCITWLVEPAWKDIVHLHAGIDSVIVFNRDQPFKGLVQLRKDLHRTHFDITIDLQRHLKSGFFSLLSGAKRRIGFHRHNTKEFNWLFNNEHIGHYDESLPKIDHYLRFIEHLFIPKPKTLDFGLSVSPVTKFVPPPLRAIKSPFVAVVMGSSWVTKDWCQEGYSDLVRDILSNRQVAVVLIGDTSKINSARLLQKETGDKRLVNLTGQTSLLELLAVLKQAAAVVGPDSGPGHMAAAVGTPYVTLFGPTPVARVVPYNCENLVVTPDISCAPCNKKKCPKKNVLCMRNLSMDLLREKLDEALAPIVSNSSYLKSGRTD